jgi:outer membrane lipoprotein-sorting protein
MSANPPSPTDDPLTRAEAALQRTPVPEGPSEETLARTLAALRAAASEPKITLVLRRRTMLAALKIAAAVLVAAGGLFYVASGPPVATPMAFAEVAQTLREARTLAYRMSMQVPGQKDPVTVRLLSKEPGLIRAESDQAGGPISIIDVNRGKTLVLDPAAKAALLVEEERSDARREPTADAVVLAAERFRTLAEREGTPVGQTPIGNVQAQGFRVKEDGRELIVWADPKTRRPLRVESTVRVQDQDVRVTLSEIELDPKLDDALFRLEPPQGYTLRKAEAAGGGPEDAIVRLLRAYAEKSGGTFPPRFDDWAAYDKQFRKERFTRATDPELLRLVQTVIRVQLFLLERKGDYGYKADGVKLGDAETILFWYRPTGASKYRAIFGDLHVGDVTADQLPERPEP